MKEYAVLVGLDWADKKHDVCWSDTKSGEMHTAELKHDAKAIEEWIKRLSSKYPGERIAVCLEQSRGAVVYALMSYAMLDLYPINPVTVAKYRKAFRPSGAKDDPGDAALLHELLERHPQALKKWKPEAQEIRLLRSLCEDRRKAVDQRKALCNSLRAKLKEYFPEALNLVGEQLYSEMCCAFLMKWPHFEAIAAARPQTVHKFYYQQGSRSKKLMAQRLEFIATSRAICTDEAVVEAAVMWVQTLIPQIRAYNRSIKRYEQRIDELFKAHEDHEIFLSFPGAAQTLAPRLLCGFGTNRDLFASAVEATTYFGIAPVIERSGQQVWIHWRWLCPKFVRQSFVEFAGQSIRFSSWARVYYKHQIQRGKGHNAAVRALAYKWIRIMFRCWQTRTLYDEAQYIASLQKHGSWIAADLKYGAEQSTVTT